MSMLFPEFFQKNSSLLIFNIKFTFLPDGTVKTTIAVIYTNRKTTPFRNLIRSGRVIFVLLFTSVITHKIKSYLFSYKLQHISHRIHQIIDGLGIDVQRNIGRISRFNVETVER